MRLHLSHDLIVAIRRPQNMYLRRMIESLFTDPRPDWAMPVAGEKDRFEFVAAGLWVQYKIDRTGGETIIKAIIIEPPF